MIGASVVMSEKGMEQFKRGAFRNRGGTIIGEGDGGRCWRIRAHGSNWASSWHKSFVTILGGVESVEPVYGLNWGRKAEAEKAGK